MGGSTTQAPAAPATPNYTASSNASVDASIAQLQAQDQINQAAQLGLSGSVALPGGGTQNYNFNGLGNAALQGAQAQTDVNLLNQYGPQLVAQETALTAQADPTRAALNQQYEATTANQLAQGGQLDPSVARQVDQTALGASAARGNILGNDSAASEAMSTGVAAEQLQQQRTANAQATLGLAPVSSQFGNINQATAPIASAAQQQVQTLNPNASALGTTFAQGIYGDQAAIYNSQSQNYQNAPANPWMTLAGTAIGAGASSIGSLI